MTPAILKPTTPPLKPYAVRIDDDSMFPALEPGDIALADPGAPVADGRNVIVWVGGEMYLKRLVSRDSEWVRCMHWNPQTEVLFPVAEVQAIHAVFGWQREA
jgi:phage repressor protein C with HTH and peptisase S24 domain